jgi:CPA2 family monovalent cation:H+ antiporter-2
MDQEHWLKDVCVFLAAAGLVVPLFRRVRIGAVLGFLLIGLVIGPHGLGKLAADYPFVRFLTIEDRERVAPFAELGVMFLLFLIGLEFSFARLWSLRRFVLGVGGMQFIASAAVIGLALALFGVGGIPAMLLGFALAMSSTAVVMQLLEEQGRSATSLGQIAISVLLFQDLMVAPLLFVVEFLGRGETNVVLAFGSALIQAAGAVALIAIAGRYLLRPLFRFAARTGSRELIMAITVLIVVGVAAATGAGGLSTALGAFLAGLLLAETEYRHQVEIDLEPFKGLLMGLFFVTVGMGIDVAALAPVGWIVLAVVIVLMVAKAIILIATSRIFGIGLGVGTELGLLLAQAGEFGFVVVALGRGGNLIAPELTQLSTAVIGLSMVLTPLVAALAAQLGRVLEPVDHSRHLPERQNVLGDHVIIGGYGRVGQAVARLLKAENVPFIALDGNAELVSALRKVGHPVYFGDAARSEMLERVGAARARAFVVTVNAPRAAERMITAARRRWPDALVIARAKDPAHAARLLRLGAVGVIPEAVEASLQLGARVLEALGLPDEAVDRRIEEARNEELAALRQQE